MPLNRIEACMQILIVTICRRGIKQGEKYNTTEIRIASFIIALAISFLMIISSVLSMHYDSINKYYVYGSTQPQLQLQPQQQDSNLSLSTLMSQGSPLLGNPTAPVTIIDFSDFECYLCARYVKSTEPLINQTYIQSGKVALVFKHLPNRGFDSMGASLAAQCANDQGKFWQFHQLLYKNQKPIDSGWVSSDNLKDGSNPQVLKGAHPFPSFKAIIDKKLIEVEK